MYSVLTSAVNHPDATHPLYSVFNHRSLSALADGDVALDVVVPRPFVPPVGPYSSFGKLPAVEEWNEYDTHHPKFVYYVPKRLLYALTGESFANRVPDYAAETFDTPDVVHACHIYLDGYGLLPYCRDRNVPLVVVAHGTVLNRYENLPPGVRSRVRVTLEESARVLCVSDALAERAITLVDESKVATVPLGADPEKYPTAERESIRRELGFDPNSTLVLFVGAFTHAKGVDELASVLPRLSVPNLEFALVGHSGGKRWELLDALTRSRYPNRHVYWQLSPTALRRWYAAADLLVLPSHTEGRPTVVYEAMASETAVLATAVGGVPEQVVDGETGRLIPPRDADALEASLATLCTDRNRLRQMGQRGLERLVSKGWTWSAHGERLRHHHQTVLEERGASASDSDG